MPVAIVTGSDSGIGKATAVQLAEDGFDVGITWHRDESGANETAEEVRSLARKLRLSKPSVTSAIGTLERAGLVERERSTEDKRLVSVALTGEGRRLVRKALDALHRCEREFTAGLTKSAQRQMAAWLRRVGDAARNGRWR